MSKTFQDIRELGNEQEVELKRKRRNNSPSTPPKGYSRNELVKER
jgi:hypothetical protein